MNHRRKLVVVAALVAMCTSIFIGVGPAAASAPPPITLSQSSGQAGTTVTVTLPAPCTVPTYDAPDPYALEVLITAVNGDTYDPTDYAGTPGVPITQVTLPIPADLAAGHYVISASCSYGPGPFGDAYFNVTSTTQLPSLTVAPQSVGQGQVVDVTGDCSPIPSQPAAYLFVAIASATDPGNIVASDDVSGPGPTITVPITIPSTAPPGSYFITATCGDYTTFGQFAESPLTITGTVTATTLTTSLTNSLGQSGTTVTSGTNVGVTDDAVLSGTNVATASGTVTYSVFSDSACTVYVGSGGTVQLTDGQAPVSSPVSLPSLGTYYWQASYSGDGQNAPVAGACGSEVEDVDTTLTTVLSGGGQSGSSITVTAGDPVTDAATMTGPGSSTANGSVTYSFYFDSGCTQPVDNAGNPTSVTVAGGSIPSSGPIDLGGGTYYWQAEFIDDAGKVAASTCGSEIETVNTNLTTTLTGGGQSGTSISVPEGTAVTDTAKFIGSAASNATGTVEYFVYSDSNCVYDIGTFGTVTVTNGVIPSSDPVTLDTPGTYYWLAYYDGDSNYPSSVTSCGPGSEVETVTSNTLASTSVSTSLSGGGQTGASVSVPSGTAVSDTATLSGTNTSSAAGTVTYTVYSDSACTTSAGNGGTMTVSGGVVPASDPVTLGTPGTYYWQASYSGDSTNAPSKSTCGSEVETVTAVTSPVTVTTSLSGGGQTGASVAVPSGTAVSDTATLSGSNAATAGGTVTYNVYSDSNCTQQLAGAEDQVAVTDGGVPASTPVTLAAGTYYWQASYSGDSTNAPSKSTCGSEVETVTAVTSPVTVTTSLSGGGQTGASVSVPSGTAVSDTATLSGTNTSSAAGTVTYTVYSDSACTTSAGNGGTMTVSGGVVPASDPVTLGTPGTYYWQASYSGDSTNAPSKSTCGSEVETVTAVTSPVTVTTSLSGGGQTGASVAVPSGTAVSDTATLSGSNAATAGGTVTYNVYSDSNCTQQLAGAEDQVAVTDGGVPASTPVTLAAGTYYWQASYSGDSTNAPSKSTCGSEVETVTAVTSPVTVTTSLSGGGQTGASVSVPSGTAVSDTATLSGTNTSSAAGTVTYTVYSDSACTTSAGNGGTMTVSGGVVPASDPVTLGTPGTYYWQASYSGDSTNAPSKSTCGSEVETVTSTTASTSVSTSLSGPATCTSWPGSGGHGGGSGWRGSGSGSGSGSGNGSGSSGSGWGGSGKTGAGSSCTKGQTGASISVPSGAAVSDTATLSGANTGTAGGTVTYTVYSNDTCTTSVKSAGTVTVSKGSVPTSTSVTLTFPGKYYWQASYSGDSTNSPSASTCDSEVETVTSTTASTSVSTSLSGPATCTSWPGSGGHGGGSGWGGSGSGSGWGGSGSGWGGSGNIGAGSSCTKGQTGASISVPSGAAVSDTATLSGANTGTAGGTVTYTVYSNDTCTTSVKSAGTVTVSKGSVPTSTSVTLTFPGKYYWQASYSGDSTNSPSTSTCGSEVETVTSTTASTSVSTSLSGPATCTSWPGSGGHGGGSGWRGSGSGSGSGSGNGSGSSGSGWGGSGKTGGGSSCTKGQTGASISVPSGAAVSDTATLSGANTGTAGGTVTYTVYSNDTCTTSVKSAGTVTVSKGSVPTSTSVTLTFPGKYYWQASYSGDSTNSPSASTCDSEVETVT